MKKILLFFIIALTTQAAHGKELQALLSHYTTANGLASNAISDIAEDKFGYMWIATWNGLSRFDGYEFCNYPTGKGSGLDHFHNRILTLTADTGGNIWMRMYDDRIFVLNRKTDIISNAFGSLADGYAMKTNNGTDDKTHRTASTLVSSADGMVYAYIPQKGIYRMRSVGRMPWVELIDIGKRQVYAMAADKGGNLWVATSCGLAMVKPSETTLGKAKQPCCERILNIFCSPHDNSIIASSENGTIYDLRTQKAIFQTDEHVVTSIYEDSQRNIWLTTNKLGVSLYNTHDKSTRTFTQNVATPDDKINGASFCETGSIVWVRMNLGGFGYYDYATGEMSYFHNNPNNSWNLSNTVSAFVAQKEGVVWMSTIRRGLEKLSIIKPSINRAQIAEASTTYGANETRAIIYDLSRQKAIIGTKAGDILCADIHSPSKLTMICHVGGKIYDMASMANGDIYISTKGNGIFVLPKGKAKAEHLDIPLSSSNVYQTLKDKAGRLWIATYEGGVNMYDGKKVHTPKNIANYPKEGYAKVRSIAIAPDGDIWAGSSDGILTLRTKGKGVVAAPLNISDTPEKQTGNNDIIQIAVGRDGTIWVATNGGGLSKTTGKDEKDRWCFDTYNESDGLPSSEIKSIALAQDNSIWFSADQTLCSFDTTKNIFTTFSILDGVGNVSFSEGAGVFLPNGTLLFGTTNGYYIVDKSKLKTHNGASLKLAVTDFYIDDKRITPRTDNTYDYYVPDSGKVRLPSRSSVFAFKFASLNYQLQHRVHYQYKLEGYDKEWKIASESRMVSYSNVPAGKYTFHIKAFLLESPDKYDERTMEIQVPPYVWASATAMWIYLAFAIASIAAIIYVRRKRQEEARNRIKNMRVLKIAPEKIAFNDEGDYNFVSSILEWLEKNFDNPALKIEDMASESGLSRTSFYNQLKTLTGQSPKEFVSEFRMKKAYMYLENSNMTIAEIAYKTGFNDPVYFARSFKQRTGMTPKAYRERKNKEKENADTYGNELEYKENTNTQQQ